MKAHEIAMFTYGFHSSVCDGQVCSTYTKQFFDAREPERCTTSFLRTDLP
jgi:hypothetical protein